ncbi:Sodium-dependent glucose transporter 1-like protein [Leptotrombidium deliense]|uniref:Sodium-dependent glucose transporter 1-like protein n=1 Tax=Leptotrombidium deliense TaxID=299467 RepID=A0A443SSA6_9ACAR|nr:Sodium-dependent glucose transporter 1-like protein [Leptotrombidium deliense]
MLFWQEIKAHKYRFLKTAVLYASFIFLGANAALPGATLLDLQIAVNVGIEQITFILPSRSAGYALGAFANTLVVDTIDTQLTLLFSISLSIISVAVIPWNRSFIGLCVNLFIGGFLTGILDSEAIPVPYTPSDLKIPYAYSIVSVYTFLVFIALLLVYVKKRDNKPHPSRRPDSSQRPDSEISTFTYVSIVAVTSTFMLIYCGLELVFGTLLLTYAVKCDLRLSKSMAAFLTSAYWGGYTFFRLFVVLIVEKVGCQKLLIFDLAVIMLSNVILMPFGNTYLWGLWTGVILVGIGTSSVFGAVFGFLEDFVTVTGKMTSTFMYKCLKLKKKVIHENPIYSVKL